MTITLTINGTKVDLDCQPHDSLRAVLRKPATTVSDSGQRRARPAQLPYSSTAR